MKTILVVDDRPINRRILIALLEHCGYRVLESSDGREALENLRRHRPELVITDILMPGMSGVEFAQQVRAEVELQGTPIIFYTATYQAREANVLARTCGVEFVLVKPAPLDVILATVARALGLPQAPMNQPLPPGIPTDGGFHPKTKLAEYWAEASCIGQRMNEVLKPGHAAVSGEREQLQALSEQLLETTQKLQNFSLRMVALTELDHLLAAQRDPKEMLEAFCRGAHEIMTAKAAVLGMLDANNQLSAFYARGITEEMQARVRTLPPREGVAGRLLETRRPIRWSRSRPEPLLDEFRTRCVPVDSFLGVPIICSFGAVGWIYFIDRLAADEFTDDDLLTALTLAAQAAVTYEKALLHQEGHERNARLENEMVERRRAEEQLRQLNTELDERVRARTAQLEATNKELDAFSHSVSHDLRAPLRHIGAYLGALRQALGPDLIPEGRRYLEQVLSSAGHMGKLIDDLLAFSRMGRAKMRLQKVDLQRLIAESIHRLDPDLKGRNIRWTESDLPAVEADPEMLLQVMINLLANALKYTRPRNPAVIQVGCAERTSREVVIFVRDNGVGFDMAYADKLFGVFQRLHLDEEFEGTGLGLANVRRIIARHGGRTWAEGKVDRGATFYFSLPRLPQAEAECN